MTIDPKTLTPGESYGLLVSAIVPRPIAFVTSMDDRDVVNAAPFSFFNAIASSPPLIMISANRKKGNLKQTTKNILARKEFVVNIVHEAMAAAVNIASADFPEEISKIDLLGMTLLPSVRISSPRIAASLVHCECTLYKHIEIGNEPVDLIIGEIVQFHVKDELLVNGVIDQTRLEPIARMGGNFFSRTNDLFQLERYEHGQKK